jgi:hypothetical protein
MNITLGSLTSLRRFATIGNASVECIFHALPVPPHVEALTDCMSPSLATACGMAAE